MIRPVMLSDGSSMYSTKLLSIAVVSRAYGVLRVGARAECGNTLQDVHAVRAMLCSGEGAPGLRELTVLAGSWQNEINGSRWGAAGMHSYDRQFSFLDLAAKQVAVPQTARLVS